MKGLYSILCGVQPVRVIYGDGQVLYLPPLTTVEEVLQCYPHHFVCQPGLNSYSGSRSNQMLAMDTELQSGRIYFLLPLPRLFPTAPSPSPQSCTCYAQTASDEGYSSKPNPTKPYRSPLKIYSSPQRIGGLGSPFRSPRSKCSKYFLKNSKSKVLPESNLYSGGRCDAIAAAATAPPQPRGGGRRCPWRPRLGCISEEDDMDVAMEELRHHRRQCFAAGKPPPAAAAKLLPPSSPRLAMSSFNSARIMSPAMIWSNAAIGIPSMVLI